MSERLSSRWRGPVVIQSRSRRATVASAFLAILLLGPAAVAQPMVSLMTPTGAWSFDNGSEFPGATGGLTVEARTGRDGKDSLKLVGNFSRGGNYVQAGRAIGNVDVRELSMWVRTPDVDRFTIRLNDASGQTHQIDIKIEARADWQRIDFPLERFFARRGQSDAVTVVAKYESWGGARTGIGTGRLPRFTSSSATRATRGSTRSNSARSPSCRVSRRSPAPRSSR